MTSLYLSPDHVHSVSFSQPFGLALTQFFFPQCIIYIKSIIFISIFIPQI